MDNIAVTYVDVITPCGLTLHDTWDSIIKGHSAVPAIKPQQLAFYQGSIFMVDTASEVGVERAPLFTKRLLERIKPKIFQSVAPERIAVVYGQSKIGFASYHQIMNKAGNADIYGVLPSNLASYVARTLTVGGTAKNLVAACATGLFCVIEACRMLERGDADMVIAGSAESSLVPEVIAGFDRMGVLTKTLCRPFAKGRDGFVIGEGAGILILERLATAIERGAEIIGLIKGGAWGIDLHGPVTFDSTGEPIARVIRKAMAEARIAPTDIGYIHAHGTGTLLNDQIETRAIKQVFGQNVPVSSTKPFTGHLLGAAGAVELCITLKALQEEVLPPTLNYQEDPELKLDYIPFAPRKTVVQRALKLSYGFGGQIAAVVIERL